VTQWSRPRRVLSEIMHGSQVPMRDAVPADSPGHGHTRNDGRLIIRGNGRLPLIEKTGSAADGRVDLRVLWLVPEGWHLDARPGRAPTPGELARYRIFATGL
jgi:hypothetical protein